MSPFSRQLRVVHDQPAGEQADSPTLRIAFATSDKQRVDEHFGSCTCLQILAVSARHHQLDTLCTFTVGPNGHDDGKLLARLVALDGCDAVYCLAIGPSAIRQLIGAGIQPVRLEQPATIAILVAELQQQLRGSPSGWLARTLALKGRSQENRLQALAADGWQEQDNF